MYHELFDEALAAYNAKKKKTRDKIPDYYEHIRQSKQEKLFHEAIFQIGNLNDCGCGSPGGERAAAALKEFAESFQERNPHLRVFNMVLHMDEATPHLHVDFVPVATEQSRGLSTRVSMKQALKQQGFESLGRKQTEWKAWMEREKASLAEIAQAHEFEIVSLGGGRPHMDLPEYRAAAQRLEAVQEQVTAAEQDMAVLERQKKALRRRAGGRGPHGLHAARLILLRRGPPHRGAKGPSLLSLSNNGKIRRHDVKISSILLHSFDTGILFLLYYS